MEANGYEFMYQPSLQKQQYQQTSIDILCYRQATSPYVNI